MVSADSRRDQHASVGGEVGSLRFSGGRGRPVLRSRGNEALARFRLDIRCFLCHGDFVCGDRRVAAVAGTKTVRR